MTGALCYSELLVTLKLTEPCTVTFLNNFFVCCGALCIRNSWSCHCSQ